ncbi:unnamed protein product [Darwinula stevensoni]|uniref:Ectonucleotide pyrophosphatase/phosphodiesterase family member 6 n=1 Tax=Darwinula stevensoni TaxID=69355 RepID=A0A7R9FRZ4_9CRUS|nr:unnamed protein product [Darwinula stevensoni]CAG0902731.1 unnamed protein product [Darwinula stevensoni]
MEKGSRATRLRPVFPSEGYPAWTTISTGVWPEDHGIIGDNFHDRSGTGGSNRNFERLNNRLTGFEHWWQNAEPIWVTAANHKRSTALYLWSRCDVAYRKNRAAKCIPYDDAQSRDMSSLEQHLKPALTGFERGEVDLAMVYNGHVEDVGVKFGPDSAQMQQAVRNVDRILGTLCRHIENTPSLNESLNLIVVGDHGMASLEKMKKVIVEDEIPKSEVKFFVGRGGYMNILPEVNRQDQVGGIRASGRRVTNARIEVTPDVFLQLLRLLKKLPGVEVMKKAEIPDRLHVKKSPLFLDVLVLANQGRRLASLRCPEKKRLGWTFRSSTVESRLCDHRAEASEIFWVRNKRVGLWGREKSRSLASKKTPKRKAFPFREEKLRAASIIAPFSRSRFVVPGTYLTGVSDHRQIARGPEVSAPTPGVYGYDPQFNDMATIFFGLGPGFKAGEEVSDMEMVDVYAVVMHLLEMESPRKNMTTTDEEMGWQRIRPLLTNSACQIATTSSVLLTFLTAFLLGRGSPHH